MEEEGRVLEEASKQSGRDEVTLWERRGRSQQGRAVLIIRKPKATHYVAASTDPAGVISRF